MTSGFRCLLNDRGAGGRGRATGPPVAILSSTLSSCTEMLACSVRSSRQELRLFDSFRRVRIHACCRFVLADLGLQLRICVRN